MVEDAYTGTDLLETLACAKRYNRFLADQVVSAGDGVNTMVDFGAGSGTIARILTGRGCAVQCVEADAGLAQGLRESGFEVSGTVSELRPFPYLYSLNVLEHIEDDQGALVAIHARLLPGGRVYFYVPAFMVLYSSMDRQVGHHRRYRLKPLRAQFEAAGFVVDDARYADSLGFLAALLFKWLGNDRGEVSEWSVRFYDRFIFPCSRLLDLLTGHWFGKNVMIQAHRPEDS
jgi:hypothetical protein